MKDKTLGIIKEYDLIEENDNIVIGVSGGPDSMALLFCLLEIKQDINFNIYIAHVNHGVRGKEADKDQLFVEKIANELNLPFFTKNVNMILYGKEKGITAEEAGRELRYGFFREILGKYGGGKIAVAHNMNDQAETLIMRFMRGTGIDGLKGMDFKINDIIRPILGINRWEIEEYIEKNQIPTVLDKTNLEPIYTRNKIRLELIPYMEKNFNPNLINTLWRMSKISSMDSDFLEEYSKGVFEKATKSRDDNSVSLCKDTFLNQHRSIQQRMIRYGIFLINKSLQGISEAQISLAFNLFTSEDTGKKINLSSNIVAKNIYGSIFIGKEESIKNRAYSYGFKVPGNIYINNNYYFQATIFDNNEDFSLKTQDDTRYFDFDKVKGKLEIRNRRDGDRFTPFGMSGTKKIKDYFIDEKIPRDLREETPLIVDDENILWVVGYRTNNNYKITKETKRILSISYKRIYNT